MHEEDLPFTHKRCVEICARWMAGKCKVVLPEFVSMSSPEIADVLGFNASNSYMIEVKVSRSDFLRDKHKDFRRMEARGVGNYRYYACPAKDARGKRIINVLEIPDGWGMIYIYPNGRAVQMLAPDHKPANIERERVLLYSYARRAVVKGLHPEIMKPIPKPER